MLPVLMNCRAAGQPLSGVPRYVANIAKSRFGEEVEKITPSPTFGVGMKGHLWEQTVLAAAASRRRSLILSPANTGPAFFSRQVVVVHDMATFDVPWAFSLGFSGFYQNLYRVLFPSVAGIVTISEFTRSRVIHYFPECARKIVVVHNGTDHIVPKSGDTVSAAVIRAVEGGPYLFFVGSKDPRKNMARVIDAVRRVRAGGVKIRVLMAGGALPGVFSDRGVAEGISKSSDIHALGRVSDTDLHYLITRAGALIFPSLYEGFGLPPLEAIRLGVKRLIVSDIPPLREVLPASLEFISPHSIEALAGAIIKFAEGDMPELNRREIDEVNSRFTWERCTAGLREACLPHL